MKTYPVTSLKQEQLYKDTENDRLVKMGKDGVLRILINNNWVEADNNIAFNGYVEVHNTSNDVPLRELYNQYLAGTAGKKQALHEKVLSRIIKEIEDLKGV